LHANALLISHHVERCGGSGGATYSHLPDLLLWQQQIEIHLLSLVKDLGRNCQLVLSASMERYLQQRLRMPYSSFDRRRRCTN
jgi:hypothetical protein